MILWHDRSGIVVASSVANVTDRWIRPISMMLLMVTFIARVATLVNLVPRVLVMELVPVSGEYDLSILYTFSSLK